MNAYELRLRLENMSTLDDHLNDNKPLQIVVGVAIAICCAVLLCIICKCVTCTSACVHLCQSIHLCGWRKDKSNRSTDVVNGINKPTSLLNNGMVPMTKSPTVILENALRQ